MELKEFDGYELHFRSSRNGYDFRISFDECNNLNLYCYDTEKMTNIKTAKEEKKW